MRKKSFWLVIGLMIATLVFAFVGCKDTPVNYELSETEISLKIGESKQLKISPTPQANVSWESNDGAVATVQDGLVFAVGTGNAVVTAKIAGVEKALECTVTVTEEQVEVDGCKLETVSVSLKAGETFQLNVIDANDQVVQNVTWTSSDNAIATVSDSGLVTAAAAGDAMISATLPGGTLVCKVTVTQKNEYKLDKTELDLAVGGSDTLTLITLPEGSESPRPHTFTSADPSIATVDGGTGKVTGVSQGTTKIICSVDGQEIKADVTVTEYTVTIDNEAWTKTLELKIGETAKIDVTADPTRTIEADYHSDDESVVTVTNGNIVAVDEGTTNISVTIGGRTWTCTVSVRDAVVYSFENDEITIKLGGTGELTVVADPVDTVFEVTFDTDQAGIVTIEKEGAKATLTAVGLGDVQVIAKITGTNKEIKATVHVIFGVTQTEVEYFDGQPYSVNLDALDKTNETLDWRYYGRDNYTERKNGGNLIGDIAGTKADDFYDYRVPMTWSDGTTDKENTAGRVDGITFKQDATFTVKVTADVKYIAIFTGAWHATNTVSISYNGAVCASKTFTNNGGATEKNMQIIFTPDVEGRTSEMEFTVKLGFMGDGDNANNVSLVAIAVVGNTERAGSTPSATAETPVVSALTDTTVNLSTVGNEDWVYANNGGSMARKTGVSGIIKENDISYSENPGTDPLDNGFGWFNWYDADGSAPTADGQVRHFRHVGATYSIPVHLTTGTHTVTLYLSGWKNSYYVSVLDGNNNAIVDAHQVVEGNGSTSKAVKVVVTLTVTKEDDFAFRMTKSGDGNHGWAAIAVSNETAFELTQREYNLEIGGEETAEILLSGSASVTYESANTGVATVSDQGVIQAVALGTTYITITDSNGAKDRVFVTVAKAASLNKTSLTLTLDDEGKKSDTLQVMSGDGQAITDEVTYETSNDLIVTVSSSGEVEAKALGKATITVQYGPTTFKCEVEVIAANAKLEDLDWNIESLERASSTYKTIDYKHWSNESTVEMADADLIGDPDGANDNFWDYKGAMSYGFNVGSNRNLGKSYGKVCKESFTINITLNDNVTGVVFYTGAYHGTGVVSFKIGEKVLTTAAFTAAENGIARKIVVNISASDLEAGQTLVIEGRVEKKTGDGNVNVNAVAVIGNEPQDEAAATGSATREQINGRNLVDLTAVGSHDWIYAHYENPVEPTYRKFNGPNVFTGETYYGSDGNATGDIIRAWNGASAFKWTDGIRSDIQSSDEENYKASANPVDNDGGNDWSADGTGGVDGYTNNYNSAVGEIHIQMHLAPGTYTIRAYLHSWKADLGTGIYDSEGNFITGKVCLSNEPGGDSDWLITFTLEVTKDDTFNLVLGKVRSHGSGDRQFGWSAIAVAQND